MTQRSGEEVKQGNSELGVTMWISSLGPQEPSGLAATEPRTPEPGPEAQVRLGLTLLNREAQRAWWLHRTQK